MMTLPNTRYWCIILPVSKRSLWEWTTTPTIRIYPLDLEMEIQSCCTRGKTGTKCKYVSIGASIFAFQTDNDVITHYYSDIGNNDVPYPVAVGKKYVYFLTAHTQVDKSAFPPDVEWHAAYEDFYGYTENP